MGSQRVVGMYVIGWISIIKDINHIMKKIISNCLSFPVTGKGQTYISGGSFVEAIIFAQIAYVRPKSGSGIAKYIVKM